MKLPDGFLLDQSPAPAQQATSAAPGLPDGFELDAPKPDIGRGKAFLTGAGQGLSLGSSDEMAGLESASPLQIGRSYQETRRAAEKDLGFSLPSIPNPVDMVAGAVRLGAEKIAPSIFGTRGGEQYDAELANNRADIKSAQEQYPLTTLAGNVAGGLALPIGAGVNTVRGAAATGAGLGALTGFNTGEGLPDRLAQAATGGVIGGAVGGAAGALVNKLASPATKAPNPVVDAAQRLDVSVPRAVASDSTFVQRAGQSIRNVPGAGDVIVNAQAKTVQGLDDAATAVSQNLGSGERFIAGQGASDSIRGWMTNASKATLNKAFDAVDAVVDPAVKTQLNATRQIASDIMSRRGAANLADESGAVSLIRKAVENGDGLTYEGIKTLRTSIGERMKGNLVGDISEGELKQIYGALTDDLKTAIRNAGGARGEVLWQRANDLTKQVADRRDQLAKIVGADGSAPAETVFDRIAALAGESGRGNIELLAKARKVVGPDEWNDVASAIVARIGRDADGNLTPDRFVTAWGKLSDNGKSVLFSPVHRQALDDIATVSRRMAETSRRFGNPSGTAQNLAGPGIAAGLVSRPLTTLGSLVSGNILARILAAPATASSAAKWAKVYEVAVQKPTAATISGLNIASRNLANTVSDKLGVSVTAEQIMRGLAGPRASYGEPQQQEQRQ